MWESEWGGGVGGTWGSYLILQIMPLRPIVASQSAALLMPFIVPTGVDTPPSFPFGGSSLYSSSSSVSRVALASRVYPPTSIPSTISSIIIHPLWYSFIHLPWGGVR